MRVYRCLNCQTTQAAAGPPKRCMCCRAAPAWLRPEDEGRMWEDDRERAQALAEESGRALTERLRSPGENVSASAGDMERESPLFYGKGSNPTLF